MNEVSCGADGRIFCAIWFLMAALVVAAAFLVWRWVKR